MTLTLFPKSGILMNLSKEATDYADSSIREHMRARSVRLRREIEGSKVIFSGSTLDYSTARTYLAYLEAVGKDIVNVYLEAYEEDGVILDEAEIDEVLNDISFKLNNSNAPEIPAPLSKENTIEKIIGESRHELLLFARRAAFERKKQGDREMAKDNSALDSYQLVEEIGRGGFGTVYRAIKRTIVGEFQVAIKILEPSAFVDDSEPVEERFRREVLVVQKLKHRAIISYIDAGFDREGKPYFVMPLIEGKDLRATTAGRSLLEIIDLFLEVLNGLNHAHNIGVLHRDLKPANILVNEADQQPKILDFGCAHLHGEATITLGAVGTPAYIPYEVMEDPTLRIPEHDIYSCGIILYEIIAGRRPEPGNYIPLATATKSTDNYYELVDFLIQSAIAPLERRISTMNELFQRTVKLRGDLDKLLNPSNASAEVAFAAQVERFKQSGILDSLEQKKEMRRFLHKLGFSLKAKLRELSKSAKFSLSMNGPSVHEENGYPAVNMLFDIYLQSGKGTPQASNTFRIEDDMYVARFGMDGEGAAQEYSRVSIETPNTFESMVLEYAHKMIGKLIEVYMERN
jgi:serine/threonine protein kinase